MARLNKIEVEKLRQVAAKVTSSSQAAREFGLPDGGGTITRLRKLILENQIDISHWTGQLWSKGKTSLEDERLRKTKDNSLIFTENSNASSHYVRKLILKHKLKEYKCEADGCTVIDMWNNKPISLQLDHINGNRKDHRLSNLRWLCPSCHSQTDTFCARNSNKKSVSEEDLKKALLESPNIRQALSKFDLENGGNYRRAKRLIKSLVDQEGKAPPMLSPKELGNNRKCLVCESKVSNNSFDYCSQECSKYALRKVKDRPSQEQLLEELKTTSYVQMGKKYGVSDNAIRKWLKSKRVIDSSS